MICIKSFSKITDAYTDFKIQLAKDIAKYKSKFSHYIKLKVIGAELNKITLLSLLYTSKNRDGK